MIQEEQAASVAEYFNHIRKVRIGWDPTRSNEEVWFRGQPKRSHALLPGLYRDEATRAGYVEEDLFERFKVLGASHPETPPFDNDWDWYFVAQHFGLPTRLLD